MANASSVSPQSIVLGLRRSALRLSVAGCALSSVLWVAVSAQIEVTTSGVGIGTANPNYALTIFDSTLPRVQLTNSLTGQNSTDGLQAYVTGVNAVLLNKEAGELNFGTDNAYRMTIDAGGNVGIGTATPNAKLSVISPNTTISPGFSIRQSNNSNYGYDFDTENESVGRLDLYSVTASVRTLRLSIARDTGNVGIGTTTPSQKLSVRGIGQFGLNDAGTNNIGGILVASGTGIGGARQYWIGASSPTSHNNNVFQISDYDGSTNTPLLTIYGAHYGAATGNVGIGTTNPGYKLEVAGTVRATSFISNTTTYADFVFKPGYQLASLAEVEQHINQHGTLPGVPSEAQVAKEGIDLAAMQVQLLQKVEELTLHAIAQHKEIAALRQELAALKNR